MGLTGWRLSVFNFLSRGEGRATAWERKCRRGCTSERKRGRGISGHVCSCTHVKILLPGDICHFNYILALRVIKQHLLNTLWKKCVLPPSQPPLALFFSLFIWRLVEAPSHHLCGKTSLPSRLAALQQCTGVSWSNLGILVFHLGRKKTKRQKIKLYPGTNRWEREHKRNHVS